MKVEQRREGCSQSPQARMHIPQQPWASLCHRCSCRLPSCCHTPGVVSLRGAGTSTLQMKKLRHGELSQFPRVPRCSHCQSQAWSPGLSNSQAGESDVAQGRRKRAVCASSCDGGEAYRAQALRGGCLGRWLGFGNSSGRRAIFLPGVRGFGEIGKGRRGRVARGRRLC